MENGIILLVTILGLSLFFTIIYLVIDYVAIREVYGENLKPEKLENIIKDEKFKSNKDKSMIYSDNLYIIRFINDLSLHKYGICSVGKNYGVVLKGTKSCKIIDKLFKGEDLEENKYLK